MNYVGIVNEVLKRLRETQVNTVAETAYSSMVGAFLNDAKDQVEEAWTWGALRQIISVATADGTSEYSLTGFGDQGKVLGVYDNTNNVSLMQTSQERIDRMKYTSTTSNGKPRLWCFRGLDGSGDQKIELYPTPDGVYDLKFNSYVPQAELSSDSTSLTIPWRPVMLLCFALVSEERGETQGQPTARAFQLADRSISTAIAIDAERHPLETLWSEE